jgi:hypothetical protein
MCLMKRYFFHTADGSRERDSDGMLLVSLDAARVQAIRFAGEVLSTEPEVLWDGKDFRIEVTDDKDMLLFTVVTLAINAPASEQS